MCEKTNDMSFVPIVPLEIDHPEMLLTIPERDKRLDTVTDCEYCENTEAYD